MRRVNTASLADKPTSYDKGMFMPCFLSGLPAKCFVVFAAATFVVANAPAQDTISKSNQAPPAFDVVAIHLSDPALTTEDLNFRQGEIEGRGVTLRFLIDTAYNVHDFQVVGIPKRLESIKYDILAKMDDRSRAESQNLQGGVTQQEDDEVTRQRLQSLLETRFGLRLHKVFRQEVILALIVAKHGSRLHITTEPHGGYLRNQELIHKMQTQGQNVTMAEFAKDLGYLTHYTVIDRTGLTGTYDFTLTFALQDDNDSNAPMLYTALQEQLGLKLEHEKGPVESYVVDHLSAPTSN
jgi:uncharacterized protein (TIGR03435 family)